MRSSSKHRRAPLRAIGPGVLLALSIGLSGCAMFDDLEPGENFADKYGDFAGFCGFLQNCGNDSDNNRGGEQTAVSTSSSNPNSGNSNNGNSNSGESARAGDAQ